MKIYFRRMSSWFRPEDTGEFVSPRSATSTASPSHYSGITVTELDSRFSPVASSTISPHDGLDNYPEYEDEYDGEWYEEPEFVAAGASLVGALVLLSVVVLSLKYRHK